MMPKRPKPQISKRRSCDRFMTTDDKKGELVNGVGIPDAAGTQAGTVTAGQASARRQAPGP